MKTPISRPRLRVRKQRLEKTQNLGRQKMLATGLVIFLWITWLWLIFFVSPVTIRDVVIPGVYLPFFLVLGSAIFGTSLLITKRKRYSFLITSGVVIFLWLRLQQLGHPLVALLLILLGFALEKALQVFLPPKS